MSFTLFTDTSANLPTETLLRCGVAMVPFTYYYDEIEHTCMDIDSFDGEQFYQSIRRGRRVTTSQINPQRFVSVWEHHLRSGQDVLYVGMSSGISGAYASSEIAAAELRERYPQRKICTVDTRAASLGEGLVVLKAVELREQGMETEEAAAFLRRFSDNICQVFTVDDLMHLRRSGRLSNASAVVGTVLNIKPVLKGNEQGQIVAIAKVHGHKKALAALAERYEAHVVNAPERVVGIAHANDPAGAAYLEELLRRNHPPKEIITVCYEPVTGSHVGPGAVALFFLGNDAVRSM